MTLVARDAETLLAFDADAAAYLRAILSVRGVVVHRGAQVVALQAGAT